MAYLCQKTEYLVLSRETISCLGMVSDINNSVVHVATVCQISSSAPSTGSGFKPGCSGGGRQDNGVSRGQLMLDLIAPHNQLFPDSQVSPGDLKPVNDPDHAWRGTLALQNEIWTCGCFPRSNAPEPLTHKDVAGLDTLFNEVLRKLIVSRYMKSGFNNCKIRPLN